MAIKALPLRIRQEAYLLQIGDDVIDIDLFRAHGPLRAIGDAFNKLDPPATRAECDWIRKWMCANTPVWFSDTDQKAFDRFVEAAECCRLARYDSVVLNVLAQSADDVCWRDVYTELATLAGVEFDPCLLPLARFISNCVHFHACLAADTKYETPNDPRTLAQGVLALLRNMSKADCHEFYDVLLMDK